MGDEQKGSAAIGCTLNCCNEGLAGQFMYTALPQTEAVVYTGLLGKLPTDQLDQVCYTATSSHVESSAVQCCSTGLYLSRKHEALSMKHPKSALVDHELILLPLELQLQAEQSCSAAKFRVVCAAGYSLEVMSTVQHACAGRCTAALHMLKQPCLQETSLLEAQP